MACFVGGLLLFSALSLAAPSGRPPASLQAQQVLLTKHESESASPRKLQGRFLHITDIHPDPFYKTGSSSDSDHACHSGDGSAGPYGAEISDCDSPFSLVNATFKWINDNLKDDVDFIIWTGDSARHDNDEEYPRSEKQVVDLNVYIVDKFVEVFGKTDNIHDPDPTNDFTIPIIPTFGNNDILPHNIFTPGPNQWTRKYATIWDRFVPEEQRHSFARGGWFFLEVIPDQLAVFSINTLYFFDSNSAVDGCDTKSEPGYEHMEWLRIQLQFLRNRGMKAIMTGHVPPARTDSKTSWDESCWQKWTLWMRMYRDVVVGSVWGHMNIDHFMFQDVKELNYKFKIKGLDMEDALEEDLPERRQRGNPGRGSGADFTIAAKNAYLNELRGGWSNLPAPPKGLSYSTIDDDVGKERENKDEGQEDRHVDGIKKTKKSKKERKKERKKEKFLKDIGGKWAERFSLNLVSPSVVPNFFPTLRVVEYNISGIEDLSPAVEQTRQKSWIPSYLEEQETSMDLMMINKADFGSEDVEEREDAVIFKKKKNRSNKPEFPVPKAPSKSSLPGPAYAPQTFTWLGYTQYYANLTRINTLIEKQKKKGKGTDKAFTYEVEYNTRNDTANGGGLGYGWGLTDLTVREYLGLAERIGRRTLGKRVSGLEYEIATAYAWNSLSNPGKEDDEEEKSKNHLWHTFVKRAFVGAKPDEELDDQFGFGG